MSRKPTHTVSVRVQVCGPDEFSEVYQSFCLVANGLGLKYNDVTVNSYLVEEFEEEILERGSETHTEDTLPKVSAGLREAGLDEDSIRDAISAMQNNGILFRERVK